MVRADIDEAREPRFCLSKYKTVVARDIDAATTEVRTDECMIT